MRMSLPAIVSLRIAQASFARAFLRCCNDLGAQRRLLLGGPLAKAFAGFEAELAVGHELFEIGRRPGPAVDRRQHGLVDRERQVGADQVGVLQRPEHREPAAEARP